MVLHIIKTKILQTLEFKPKLKKLNFIVLPFKLCFFFMYKIKKKIKLWLIPAIFGI